MGVTITKQPQSIAVANGEYVHISFTAEGEGLIYEWYYKNKDSTTFRKTTAYTSNRYELAMDASRDGRKVYCVVTDAEGNSVQTDTVAMYMTDKRGLVPMAIMSDIAKAIRAKARISEQMLPPEMAAMWHLPTNFICIPDILPRVMPATPAAIWRPVALVCSVCPAA